MRQRRLVVVGTLLLLAAQAAAGFSCAPLTGLFRASMADANCDGGVCGRPGAAGQPAGGGGLHLRGGGPAASRVVIDVYSDPA